MMTLIKMVILSKTWRFNEYFPPLCSPNSLEMAKKQKQKQVAKRAREAIARTYCRCFPSQFIGGVGRVLFKSAILWHQTSYPKWERVCKFFRKQWNEVNQSQPCQFFFIHKLTNSSYIRYDLEEHMLMWLKATCSCHVSSEKNNLAFRRLLQ